MADAKQVKANLKMKIRGGQASAAPPVGSTLGQYGVNMMDFINPFNEATKDKMGQTLTVHITIYDDRTMSWRAVGTPTDDLIRAALKIEKGSGVPNKEKVSKKLSQAQLTEIAETKMIDMNADDIESVKKMVAGTARSMGVEVEGQLRAFHTPEGRELLAAYAEAEEFMGGPVAVPAPLSIEEANQQYTKAALQGIPCPIAAVVTLEFHAHSTDSR